MKTAHAGYGPGGRANFRREIRQRRDVVAEQRRSRRELVPCQLHAVAGVSGETDHDGVFALGSNSLGLNDLGRFHQLFSSCSH